MNKPPAFQFYVKDWLSDPQLRLASPLSRGIWIDCLCFMWDAPNRGELTGPKTDLAKMLGAKNEEFDLFLSEAKMLKFCDMSHSENGNVTLVNRRMSREERNRENARLRKKRQRGTPPSHTNVTADVTDPVTPDVTLHSSSSTSLKDTICQVFDYWKQVMNHPQAKLTKDRENKIRMRLNEGYSVEQIKQAVDGCKLSPHHMGENDRNTVYDDIELICRSGSKLEGFMNKAKQKTRYAT